MSRPQREYIIYNKSTELPVYLGTITECSKCMGVSERSLRHVYRQIKNGENTRSEFEVYCVDELEVKLEEGEL